MGIRIITKGKITNLADGKEYVLAGVHARNGQVVDGGSGYCLEVRTYPDLPTVYILSLVTDNEIGGSVAHKVVSEVAAVLRDFVYTGSEEI